MLGQGELICFGKLSGVSHRSASPQQHPSSGTYRSPRHIPVSNSGSSCGRGSVFDESDKDHQEFSWQRSRDMLRLKSLAGMPFR